MTSTDSAKVEWLTVAGRLDAWAGLGLTISDDGLVPLIGTAMRIVDPASAVARGEQGIVGWAVSGISSGISSEIGSGIGSGISETVATDSAVTSVDGLVTEFVDPLSPMFADHALGASALDHVVVSTDDLERTSTAIAATTGCELKRIRELGTMRQGFHRIGRGGLIVELVERPDLPSGPASFWGLVLIVDDLDASCAVLGPEQVSAAKDAVQPGRRIATVRPEVGLGLPVALMTP